MDTRDKPADVLDKETQHQINHFVRGHAFIEQSRHEHTTSQRRNFEREVYDFSRGLNLSKDQAKAAVREARRFCGELQYDSDHSALGEEIDDSKEMLADMLENSNLSFRSVVNLESGRATRSLPLAKKSKKEKKTKDSRIKQSSGSFRAIDSDSALLTSDDTTHTEPVGMAESGKKSKKRNVDEMVEESAALVSVDDTKKRKKDKKANISESGRGMVELATPIPESLRRKSFVPEDDRKELGDRRTSNLLNYANEMVSQKKPKKKTEKNEEVNSKSGKKEGRVEDQAKIRYVIGIIQNEDQGQYETVDELLHKTISNLLDSATTAVEKLSAMASFRDAGSSDTEQMKPSIGMKRQREKKSRKNGRNSEVIDGVTSTQIGEDSKLSSLEREMPSMRTFQNKSTSLSPEANRGSKSKRLSKTAREARAPGKDQEMLYRAKDRYTSVGATSPPLSKRYQFSDQDSPSMAKHKRMNHPLEVRSPFFSPLAKKSAGSQLKEKGSAHPVNGLESEKELKKAAKDRNKEEHRKSLEYYAEMRALLGTSVGPSPEAAVPKAAEKGPDHITATPGSQPKRSEQSRTRPPNPISDSILGTDVTPSTRGIDVKKSSRSKKNHKKGFSDLGCEGCVMETTPHGSVKRTSSLTKHDNSGAGDGKETPMHRPYKKRNCVPDEVAPSFRLSDFSFPMIRPGSAIFDETTCDAVAEEPVEMYEYSTSKISHPFISKPDPSLKDFAQENGSSVTLSSRNEPIPDTPYSLPRVVADHDAKYVALFLPVNPSTSIVVNNLIQPLQPTTFVPPALAVYCSGIARGSESIQQIPEAGLGLEIPGGTHTPSPYKARRKWTSSVSRFFPKSPVEKVSCIPFPPLIATSFGLVQESLSNDPFKLLVAVMFLNKTRGKVALPVCYDVFERYPTPMKLANANFEELSGMIHELGLQNQRAERMIQLAQKWIENPPKKGQRYRKLHYPRRDDGKDIPKCSDAIGDDDPRAAWEIAHLPGTGAYAMDSWRIFCRDQLRGLPSGLHQDLNPVTVASEMQQEWTKVLPLDKELRAYVRWRWLRLGWSWNPLTGERKLLQRGSHARVENGGLAIEGDLKWSLESAPPVAGTNLMNLSHTDPNEVDVAEALAFISSSGDQSQECEAEKSVTETIRTDSYLNHQPGFADRRINADTMTGKHVNAKDQFPTASQTGSTQKHETLGIRSIIPHNDDRMTSQAVHDAIAWLSSGDEHSDTQNCDSNDGLLSAKGVFAVENSTPTSD